MEIKEISQVAIQIHNLLINRYAQILIVLLFICCVCIESKFSETQEATNIGESIDKSIKNILIEAEKQFDDSLIIIIFEEKDEVLLFKTIDFIKNYKNLIPQAEAIGISQLGSEVKKLSGNDIKKAYHLFIAAQENVPFKKIYLFINEYKKSLTKFSNYNTSKLKLSLWSTFKSLKDLTKPQQNVKIESSD